MGVGGEKERATDSGGSGQIAEHGSHKPREKGNININMDNYNYTYAYTCAFVHATSMHVCMYVIYIYTHI